MTRAGWRVWAVVLFVALVCIRMPGIIRHGRFWAEEGRVYFANAWTLPWWQALLRPEVGYLSLAANAAALLARYLVPLRDAPHVTTAIALALQTLPAILLASARDAWLRRPVVLVPAMLLLAMPVACDEVWLNTPNSQFHLALAAALCLVLEVTGGLAGRLRALLLFLAPLASPGSIALAPLFVLRAVLDRDRGRAAQAACLAAGTLLQLTLFYTPMPGRNHALSPAILACVFAVKHLAVPLLGERTAGSIADDVHATMLAGHWPFLTIAAVIAAGAAVLAGALKTRHPAPAWLLLAGGAIAGLSYAGAEDGGSGLIAAVSAQRYAFAPSCLFALAILAMAATGTVWVAATSRVMIVWLLAVASWQSWRPQDAVFAHGPSWSAEVAQWRADPTHRLAIWPTGWTIGLRP